MLRDQKNGVDFLRNYLELDEETRKNLLDFYRHYVSQMRGNEDCFTQKFPSVDDLEEEYKKSRLDAAKRKEPSASNITGGGVVKNST